MWCEPFMLEDRKENHEFLCEYVSKWMERSGKDPHQRDNEG